MIRIDEKIIKAVFPGFFGIIGIILILWWLFYNPTESFTVSVPGMDNGPQRAIITDDTVIIGEYAQFYSGVPADIPGSWPRFRGSDFDNIYKEQISLIDNWDERGPDILWSIELGEGHAAPAVLDGIVYILDYDEQRKSDSLRAFSLADGKEIWRRWYKVLIKRNHGRSRTIPAVTEKYVITIGPRGHVMAVESKTGAFLWGIDVEKDFNSEIPRWYTGQCPLIDGSTAVIATCGKALIIGVDLSTGEIIWQTPNVHNWKMSHSSIMPITFKGKKMYIYSAIGGMVGISAESKDAGTILWETTLWNNNVIAPSPIFFDDGRIYATAGYGGGSMMLKLSRIQGEYNIESIYKRNPKQGFSSEQQTPILFQGHLFGILPKDAGVNRNQFICFDPEGRIVWTSGKTNQFGLGPYILADGKFFILSDDGVLTIIKASTEAYIGLGKTKVLDGEDAWGPIALVNGLMLLRDSKKLVCIDVRKK